MAAKYHPSSACCSTPAIIGPPYEAKGKFVEIDGVKTYTAGDQSSAKALFVIYDVFGYSSQILQGADMLAAKGYRVYMPDFFEGKPAPLSWLPMPDEDGQEPPADEDSLDKFSETQGNSQKTIAKVLHLQAQIQAAQPEITKWGLMGYCWGGYVANYLLDASSPFAACGEMHPGFPEKETAEKIARPILALCSKGEPESCYSDFKPHLKVEARFVHFDTMLHGWMSARGDLQKPEVWKEFQQGYDMLAEWFGRLL